jgi:hypothetical protein
LTEAERDLAETFVRLGYDGRPADSTYLSQADPRPAGNPEDPIGAWRGVKMEPLTAAQERFAAAVGELHQRSRRRAADAEARLEAHGATVFDADSEVIGFGEPDGRP